MKNAIGWLLLVLLGLALNLNRMNELPKGVHAWSQADKYAIAHRFLENRNLLQPATFSLQTPDGSVGCEFPLIQFMVAKFCKVLGLESYMPFVYRIFIWILFVSGLFALFLIQTKFLGTPRLHAFVFSVFAGFSPVLLFYGFNFQIDVAAFGLIFMSLYFFMGFILRLRNIHFLYAILLAAIATSIKLSGLLYFGTILLTGSVFYFTVIGKSLSKSVLYWVLGFTLIFLPLWYYYNSQLYVQFNKDHYNFVFLTGPQHLEKLSDVGLLYYAFKKWWREYFTIFQWMVFFMLGFGIFFYRKKILKSVSFLHIKILTIFSSVFVLSSIGFLILMGKQFPDHDYYVIAPFLPFVILSMALCYHFILKHSRVPQSFILIGLIVLTIASVIASQHKSTRRMNDKYQMHSGQIESQVSWMQNAQVELEKAQVAKDAKVLILYEFSSNIHLIHFNRKGLIITEEELNRETPFLEKWLHLIQPDYLILRNFNQENMFNKRPYLKENIQKVFDNGTYSIYKTQSALFELERVRNYLY